MRLKILLPLFAVAFLSQWSYGDRALEAGRVPVVAFSEAGPSAPAAPGPGPIALAEAPKPAEKPAPKPAPATARTPADGWRSPEIVQAQPVASVDIAPPNYVLPLVQINAPANVEVGDMVVVSAVVDQSRSADNLQQVKFQWTVIEDGKVKSNAIVWPDGSKIFFSAGMKPKNFVVFLDVDCLFGTAREVDGAKLLADAQVESPDMLATTITVGGGPTPEPPKPPVPPVPPAPPDPPVPPAPPVVTWGPLARVVVLYESSAVTGKEPFFAQPVRDALTAVCPPDPETKAAAWRIWDKDVSVDGEPAWLDSMAKAKAGFDASQGSMLFAFDDQGRIRTISFKGLSDADAITKIQELKGK